MSKDFSYLRNWITGEGYPKDCPSRPVILECIPSRSGMSMTVYDRGERLYTINGCNGTDRPGRALAKFLEACFQPELAEHQSIIPARNFCGDSLYLDGERGVEALSQVASIIGLKVHQSESKAGTLIIIEKGK